MVGVVTAKAFALAYNLPFVAVNHLEGHALMARFTNEIEFPYLLMLTSGGHCQILAVEAPGKYEKLGGTIDDSAGEAFDKVAKMLDVGYPGGPNIEKAAFYGNSKRFVLPYPMKGREGCDFSFCRGHCIRQALMHTPRDTARRVSRQGLWAFLRE